MIVPSPLKPGDKIAIIAPSRKVSEADLKESIRIFQQWGLEVVSGKNLYNNSHGYLSGVDEERLEDFQFFLNHNQIKAIVSARGGYGSTRIIDLLDFSSLISYPKWLIGFSDITAVHLKLFSLGIVSVHGTMPILFSKKESSESINSLRNLLCKGYYTIEAKPQKNNRPGKTQGKVIGGNLSLLVDSLGTSSEPDTENCILVLEEIDEYLYRIDRMMNQLKRAGKLKNLRGLIVGHFTEMKDSELSFGETPFEIINNFIDEYSFPVAFKFPTGHHNPNLAWIHGGEASFSVDHRGALLSSVFEGS